MLKPLIAAGIAALAAAKMGGDKMRTAPNLELCSSALPSEASQRPTWVPHSRRATDVF
ncbi:hypothetical protein NOVOSPHI9U_310023 [Novosphingobium sp. 9U]|nr:hypothetical protein NOVOSPHI9U_310023 [Novosphingobium sp. 9U]